MRNIVICFLVSFFISLISGFVFIPFLRKIKAGQPILKYVKSHEGKSGTPTFGGLFFISASVISFFVFGGKTGRLATLSCVYGLCFMAIGFLDDFIKIKSKNNEGLKPYQKIIFQTALSLMIGVFCYKNYITVFILPFNLGYVNLGFFTIFLVAIIFIATVNSVNLTDGLDGLSGSVSFVYLLFISLYIYFEGYMESTESFYVILLSFSLMGAILGFLVFNTNKASVFMGDTGSLALGGFISCVTIFSQNAFVLPFLGIIFLTSSFSVIIQVVYYKKTKKRVFIMAPLHHHFQAKGFSESKISFISSLITGIMGTLLIISYI